MHNLQTVQPAFDTIPIQGQLVGSLPSEQLFNILNVKIMIYPTVTLSLSVDDLDGGEANSHRLQCGKGRNSVKTPGYDR